jgi:hypothetical protein
MVPGLRLQDELDLLEFALSVLYTCFDVNGNNATSSGVPFWVTPPMLFAG